eukprot:Ihof_evm13s104 gene=Ihof_evmTU13s104
MDSVKKAGERHVLPTTVRPVHYDLTLCPDLVNFVYKGQEDITLQIKETVTQITLNIKEINITVVTLTLADGSKLEGTVSVDKEDETATFTFSQSVTPQDAMLHVEFNAILNDEMCGFYRSSYVRPDGTSSWMAVSQMEPTDARRAFPCWDEPLIKATFTIHLTAERGLAILSNMDAASTVDVPDTNLTEVTFEKTPIMSTYLVAFLVGEFEYVEGFTKEGVRVRTYTPIGLKYQGEFSLEVATKCLSFYSDYFNIPYPLTKLDMAAISDFALGGMENWGLVTYRTVALMFDPEKSPASYKQRIAYIVGHELAHQWFGNLVTMEWWTDLWLNEGFATWVGWLSVDNIFPDWKVWDQFLMNEVKQALSLDALKSSHPIEVPVCKAKEVTEIFDAISYSKGASMIHMLATYLGAEAFQTGLRQYLHKFQYSNAVTEDLWESLSLASGKDVKTMMFSWTKQTGYPVITLTEKDNQLTATQTRFFTTGPESDNTLWIVPLRVFGSSNEPTADIIDAVRERTISLPSNSEWWKANKNQSGFFRVKYEDHMAPLLGAQIASKQLDTTDRVGIISDAFALAGAGYSSTVQALTLLQYYTNETNYTVWCDVLVNLRHMRSVWYTEDQSVLDRLNAFERKLFQNIVKSLGWEVSANEGHLTKLLRPLVLRAAGRAQDMDVVATCQAKFKAYIAGDKSAIHPDLKGVVFSVAIANDETSTTYDALISLYEAVEAEDEKVTILQLIGGGNADQVPKALQYALSDKVRSQDVFLVMESCGSNPKGREITWSYLQSEWPQFVQKFGSGAFLLGRIVASCTDGFVTNEKAEEVNEFFTKNSLPNIVRSVNQSVETIRAN